MLHLKLSTISFHSWVKVSRFSNAHYNNHCPRQFTELQIIILQDRKKNKKTKNKKNSYSSKFPPNTIQQADLCTKYIANFTGSLQRFSRINSKGCGFIKFCRKEGRIFEGTLYWAEAPIRGFPVVEAAV